MKKILYIFALMAITFVSCNTNEMPNEISIKQNLSTNTDLIIHIIKKQENPYSVTNMRKALMKLQQEGLMRTDVNIQATHLYVRFLPKDSLEFETLMKDTTLELFSYPLDCELTAGEKYIDSTLIGNQFTWLYTKVPVDFVSPVSNYEILEDLYLPTETTGSQQARQEVKSINTDNWKLLEQKSLELTGNAIQKTTQPKGMQKARWWPQVTVNVYDDLMGRFIPVEGVTVLARWWFNWESGVTNSQGIAEMSGSFGGKVNYHIKWETGFWTIRDGAFEQAYSNNPSQSGNWVANIDGGKSKYYATIHRAAQRMYYGDIQNAIRPKQNLNEKVKLCYFDTSGRSVYWTWSNFVDINLLPDIKIYGKSTINDLYRTTSDVYATTLHELAHVAHCNTMGNIQFLQVKDVVVESWAVAFSYYITRKTYSDYGYNYYGNYVYQNWPSFPTTEHYYSPLFIDLIDDYNQHFVDGYYVYDDNISGFNLAQLSNALLKSYGLVSLSANLKINKPSNVTDVQIDNLINFISKYQ